MLIQQYVTNSAQRVPNRVAIDHNGKRVTYAELDRQSNQLARLITRSGCQRGDRVAICIPKSTAAYLGMIATLKADCTYVPIDPESPPSRIRKVLESCEPTLILACDASLKLLRDINQDGSHPLRVAALQDSPLELNGVSSLFSFRDLESVAPTAPASMNQPDDAAHILFTSGSTGTPKGVVITHANVVTFVDWGVRYFDIDDCDRVSGHAPLHFDLSTFDTYGAFAAGAELHPVPPHVNLLPHKLVEFIRDRELTQWFSVPSILNYVSRFDALPEHELPSLKRLMWCGEVCPTPALIYWMKRLPHVQFTNLYGPTEATIASSYFTMPECPQSETEAVPIGVACAGEQLLILDEQLNDVETGQIGDLYLAGVGLSPGYWRDQQKTGEVFKDHTDSHGVPMRIYKTGDLALLRENGLVEFLGRVDSQIKSRGYRIELGEIESALATLDELNESAVVAIDTDQFENKAICCAFAPKCGVDVTIGQIRRTISKLVPKYMLPSLWMEESMLPKNANGKIDRRVLRERFEARKNCSPAMAGTS